MKLRQTIYKNIEMVVDEDGGMAIGNIVVDSDDKFVFAEILDSTIYDRKKLENVRAFLDEVENAMPVGTQNPDEPEVSIDKPIYQVAVRCS